MPEDAKPGRSLPPEKLATIEAHLVGIYGNRGAEAHRKLTELLERFAADTSFDAIAPSERLTERDSILITYADQVRR